MRCLALADALAASGARVTFATWADSRAVAERMRAAGFATISVGRSVPRDEPLEAADLDATLAAARAVGAAAILVDHYQAHESYLAGIRASGVGLAVIDDVADRDLTGARWLLNQNPRADRLLYSVSSRAIRLLGPQYALLRKQFAAARAKLRRSFDANDNRVLITFGGSAMADRIRAVLAAFEDVTRELEVRCILPSPDQLAEVEKAVGTSRHTVTVVTNVSDMAREIVMSDVSVNGGGATCWELCCLGTPMVTVSLSDDQSDNVSELASRGVARGVGVWQDSSPRAIAQAVAELLDAPDERAAMSARGMALVDGLGAGRAAKSLLETFAVAGVGA